MSMSVRICVPVSVHVLVHVHVHVPDYVCCVKMDMDVVADMDVKTVMSMVMM
jgi:hypothetical protein